MSEPEATRSEAEERGNRLRQLEARAARRRRAAVVGLAAFACAVVAAGIGVSLFLPRASRHRAIKVLVPSSREGAALEHGGIIRSSMAFNIYTHWHREAGALKPGHYTLSPTMTLAQIVRQLRLGPGHSPDDMVHVAVPEGFTMRQIAARLERAGITDGTAFLQMALNPDRRLAWDYGFPRPAGPLEGYLYPDTYEFFPNTPAEKVLDVMLLNFCRRFCRPYQHQISARGRSLHQIVTIASLIEREAKLDEDRPRIAGVLENRLTKGMKLEIDATIQYALGHHKQRLYNKDLLVDSQYNTYRHEGLPPGPIASPGERSLRAALAPEKNDYFYYVARPNGTHYFTRTAREHELAVRLARSERAAVSGVQEISGRKPYEPTN